MNTIKGLSLDEREMILDALAEYEEAHYMSEDDDWQQTINELIEMLQIV